MNTKETKKNIIQAGQLAVKELIKVAKEPIVDTGEDVTADRLKNAAATKKLAIFDALEILNRIEQEQAILENKPIGFPQDGGIVKPYSNLFYWAHAWAPIEDSTIGLHPHRGFEICSFVLKGEIEHYDTLLDKWITLKKGDVQVIKAGKGISHSEKLKEGSEIFQI